MKNAEEVGLEECIRGSLLISSLRPIRHQVRCEIGSLTFESEIRWKIHVGEIILRIMSILFKNSETKCDHPESGR